MLVVRYQGSLPSELRWADGALITPLTGFVEGVRFSPDARMLVVRYQGSLPSELRWADDLQIMPLSGSVTWVWFSPDASLLAISYEGGLPGELRRVDGTLIARLSGPMAEVVFSRDTRLLAVRYWGELPGELRRPDGVILAFLPELAMSISFVQTSHEVLLQMQHSKGRVALWTSTAPPRPLADLGHSVSDDPTAIFMTQPAYVWLCDTAPDRCTSSTWNGCERSRRPAMR
jgi:hypothetical protein